MTKEEITYFDDLAPVWDKTEIRSTPERVSSILDLARVGKGMDILDLGTGTGVLIPYLSRLVGKTGSVRGIDISDGMLACAREKYGKLANVSFEKLDFENDLLEGEYDMIFLYCVYPHLHEPYDTLRWLKKVNLREGGRIVIAFPSDETFINNIHGHKHAPHDQLPSAHKLAEILNAEGFNAGVIAADPDKYVVEIS